MEFRLQNFFMRDEHWIGQQIEALKKNCETLQVKIKYSKEIKTIVDNPTINFCKAKIHLIYQHVPALVFSNVKDQFEL